MSNLQVQYRPVNELVPYENNTRTHSDEQIEQVAASIEQFGFTNPILIDDQGVIAGHGRLLGAKKLGMSEVLVIELSHLTDDQRRAYIIADNKLAENAGWDDELLKLELGALRDVDFDLDVISFDDKELDRLLAEGVQEGLTDEDSVPEVEAPVSVLGDVWVLGSHRLICGDSTDKDAVLKVLNGVEPHLMVTDPPYGVKYDPKWRAEVGINQSDDKMGEVLNDDRADWTEAWQLFPGGVAYVWHAGLFGSVVQESLERAGFEMRAQIMWAKDRLALSRGHYHWQHEPCWYAVRKGKTGGWGGDRKQTTLWNIKSREDGGHGHGTQKPVECMRRPIENNSSVGQVVYEPFSGSGTTIIAAETIGRACYAVELNPAYVDVAIKRWQEFTGKEARLEHDGASFAEIEAQRQHAV